MTEMLAEISWLLKSKGYLLQLRYEPWLTEPEIAIVDRGLSALDTILKEFSAR